MSLDGKSPNSAGARVTETRNAAAGTRSGEGSATAFLVYTLMLFALTVPFWIASGQLPWVAPGLPAAAFAVVCPSIAAVLTVHIYAGRVGLQSLWRRASGRANKPALRWVALAVALPWVPAAVLLLWHGAGADQAQLALKAWTLVGFAAAAALGAWLEEIGWSGFATDLLLQNVSLPRAAVTIGIAWAAWHLPALIQAGRSNTWIAWWTVSTIAMRIVLVWLYIRGRRSVVLPSLFHASSNVCWQAMLVAGVPFDPRGQAILMTILAAGTLFTQAHGRTNHRHPV